MSAALGRVTRKPYKWQFASDNGWNQEVNAASHFDGLLALRPSVASPLQARYFSYK